MANDANGIYIYTENDIVSPWSDYMNRGQEATSAAIARLGQSHGTSAERDAAAGSTANEGLRRTLQDSGLQWLNTEAGKGWTETYHATYNVNTNPNGATVPGWYPLTGSIAGSAVRSLGGYVLPNSESVVSSAATLTVENSNGIRFLGNGWVIPVTGLYDVVGFWRGDGGMDAYIGFGTGNTADAAWVVMTNYGAALSITKKFTAGQVVKMFARSSTSSQWTPQAWNGGFGITWRGAAHA